MMLSEVVEIAEVDDSRELVIANNETTLSMLQDKADAIQSKCEDYDVVGVQNIHHDGIFLRYQPVGYSEVRTAEFTDYSLGQLCNKIGVPRRYIDKCLEAGMTDLISRNMNEWIEQHNRNFFIREYKDNDKIKIRGLLSDRYTTLDSPDIVRQLRSTFDEDDYKVKGYFISPERFHLRLVQREMLNINGEDLFAGIQIDSSDVGRSPLVVRFMIYKQVCTNGMTVSKGEGLLYHQRHIGISREEFASEFEKSLEKLPILVANAKELIEEARLDTKGYRITHYNPDELESFINRIKSQTGLADEPVAKVIDFMTNKYSETRWGLINALTEVAQDFTLERRIDLEKVAGELLLKVA